MSYYNSNANKRRVELYTILSRLKMECLVRMYVEYINYVDGNYETECPTLQKVWNVIYRLEEECDIIVTFNKSTVLSDSDIISCIVVRVFKLYLKQNHINVDANLNFYICKEW